MTSDDLYSPAPQVDTGNTEGGMSDDETEQASGSNKPPHDGFLDEESVADEDEQQDRRAQQMLNVRMPPSSP